jgi:hypothetical protein
MRSWRCWPCNGTRLVAKRARDATRAPGKRWLGLIAKEDERGWGDILLDTLPDDLRTAKDEQRSIAVTR